MKKILRDCPFCDGKADYYKKTETKQGHIGHYVGCKECGCATHGKDTKKHAIEAWNLRKDTDFLKEALDVSYEDTKYFRKEGRRLETKLNKKRIQNIIEVKLRIYRGMFGYKLGLIGKQAAEEITKAITEDTPVSC